jgi:glycosyltransferase involved in cell wall biosynthesis
MHTDGIQEEGTATPLVSVVVATHNRSDRLRQLLGALRTQTVPRDRFEVIVVDDGSCDDTPDVLRRESGRGMIRLRTVRRPEGAGPATARNAGWPLAHARLVAFTDDDCRPAPTWLERILAAADAAPGAAVQGVTRAAPDELHRFSVFARTLEVTEHGPYYETCNMAYPRAVLERLGGFDGTYRRAGGEDTDLAWRALEKGTDIVFAPDAVVYHAVEFAGPVGKLRSAARWTETIRMFRDHPQLRALHLSHRFFWRASHYLLLRALAGLLLPRRLRGTAWLFALPYLRDVHRRAQLESGTGLAAPYLAMYDVVELYGVVRGAIRYRTLVL